MEWLPGICELATAFIDKQVARRTKVSTPQP
jgi:hypothetical protein